MHANRRRLNAVVFFALVAAALATSSLQAVDPKPLVKVSFERDIQPIITGKCITCHGPSKSSGGLQFSDRKSALAQTEAGNQVIIPAHPDRSIILERLTTADARKRMPPKGEALSPAQIELLRRWISEGADWPEHWAYRPLQKPVAPQVTLPGYETWARTPIDHFIAEKLKERGLHPSAEADRQTWLRRVTFDLTGLPPTPQERDAFLADQSATAYEKVVDRLLASPRHGERWARHWMDLAHYAETHGHDQDRPRPHAWPYRDYLIRSFNEDKPYSRFVQEQVAGDILFPDDPQAIVATGFLATGPWDESSLMSIQENTLDRQIARYLDRDDIITTVFSTLTSTSVHCARCHEHKFDPIQQVEYYRLQAVFAGIDKAERPYDVDPQVAKARRALLEQKAGLPRLREKQDATLLSANLQAEVTAWEKTLASQVSVWSVLQPTSATSVNGATLTKQPDGSVLSGGAKPATDTYTIVAASELRKISGIRLEVLTDDSLPMKGPGRQDNGNLHLNELVVTAAPKSNPAAAKKLALKHPRADFNQEGWTIAFAIDGNKGTAWGIYPQVGKPHRAIFEIAEPVDYEGGVVLTFQLEQSHGGGHLIGRPRLSVTAASPLPAEADVLPQDIIAVLAVPADKRTDRQKADLAAFYLDRQLERKLAELPKPEMIYAGTNQFKQDGGFAPARAPRPIHLLKRGEITKPGAEVKPGSLSCMPGLATEFQLPDSAAEGERRAALARWLTDHKNVLVWRSIVNRVWQYHFGRGLVSTPNDFGRMGAAPTHPELLDWLAVTLRENGDSLKKLHRLIVLSAVYRQSSQHNPRFADADGDNQYLWRMNRTRLDAESLRDAVLLVSGKLDTQMGGPSVKQFIQKPGIHVTPDVDYQNFNVDDPANCRRSIYRFVFRTLPDPFMDALDCPDASQFTPVRNVSVTPLQALALLNNKFMVRQSEHLAERATALTPDLPGRIKAVYNLSLGRTPSDKELQALSTYAARHGLANVCRLLLNSNEFLFVN